MKLAQIFPDHRVHNAAPLLVERAAGGGRVKDEITPVGIDLQQILLIVAVQSQCFSEHQKLLSVRWDMMPGSPESDLCDLRILLRQSSVHFFIQKRISIPFCGQAVLFHKKEMLFLQPLHFRSDIKGFRKDVIQNSFQFIHWYRSFDSWVCDTSVRRILPPMPHEAPIAENSSKTCSDPAECKPQADSQIAQPGDQRSHSNGTPRMVHDYWPMCDFGYRII